MNSEQTLNAVKQDFESTKCFKVSKCKRVKVAEVYLPAHLSCSERSGPSASCLYT